MKDIPYVSDKLMEQVEKIFAHGPRRAKNHDQRFGQWLINKIRFNNPKYEKAFHSISSVKDSNSLIERIIWNMENPEFLEYMRDYNK